MADLRAALVAIQELHKRQVVTDFFGDGQARCSDCRQWFPCTTRRLANDALTARTTKNGDNK